MKGRTIIFHAAKGKKAEVFEAVIQAINENREEPTNEQNTVNDSWLVVDGDQAPTAPEQEEPKFKLRGKKVLFDGKGQTVLHVACRWACPAIVEQILEEVKKQDEHSMKAFLRIHDNSGRTPFMQALRDKDEICGGNQKDKVDLLLESLMCTPEEELELFTQPAPGHDTTALMHGAYGGSKRLHKVLEKIRALSPDDGEVKLNLALGIETENDRTKVQSRYGNLLAAAASGGHYRVLENIVCAIKVIEGGSVLFESP